MTINNRSIYVKCKAQNYEIIMLDDNGLYYLRDCHSFEYAVMEAKKAAKKNHANYEGIII